MNRLVSSLDRLALVSFSDAHSLEKLGREATVIQGFPERTSLWESLNGGSGLLGTIEFFPEEGKYFLDGHIKCGPPLTPTETQENKGLCPVCGRAVTVGVLNRVQALSDRNSPPLEILKPDWHILPLAELLSQVLDVGPGSQKIKKCYRSIIEVFKNEIYFLLEADLREIEDFGGSLLALAVEKMRLGQVITSGGYDGKFGQVILLDENDRKKHSDFGKLLENLSFKK
jgi:PHP family Zn ribbon phosphoesterase